MAEPFLAEIRMMSFNFPPKGWAFCNGQFLPINQNQALFALLGTSFGGNGQTTFALPNLNGRTPIHVSSDRPYVGITGGEESHTLTLVEMPQHTHVMNGTSANGTSRTAGGNVFAKGLQSAYAPLSSGLVAMAPEVVTSVGGSQAHSNIQPYIKLNFCIALQGIFPSQN